MMKMFKSVRHNIRVDDLKAALDATRCDFSTHITKITGVLWAFFSFLAPPNILR